MLGELWKKEPSGVEHRDAYNYDPETHEPVTDAKHELTEIKEGITNDVYQAHKKRVNAIRNKQKPPKETKTLEPKEYIPRGAQGEYIERMKEHATTVITNDESANMRCASFKAMDFVCRYITRTIGIKKHRVYPALRYLGYNSCYHQMKVDGSDVFDALTSLVGASESTLAYDVMMRSDVKRGFIDAVTTRKLYRVSDETKTRMVEAADNAGIRTSELNLYYVMHGLKVLVENEPDFILQRDNEIIEDVMRVLDRAEQSLLAYKADLIKLR